MAEDKTEKTGETSSALTVGELRKMIKDSVQEFAGALTGGGDAKDDKKPVAEGSPTGGGIAAEVARQVAKIREREAREQRDKDVDERLEKLSSTVVEKAPVERSRVHKFMGWGE